MEAEHQKWRTLRYMRITVSFTCGIFCLLLIVLWIRSHWRRDILAGQVRSQWIVVESVDGHVAFFSQRNARSPVPWGIDTWIPGTREFSLRINDDISVKYWSLAVAFGFLTFLPLLSGSLRRMHSRASPHAAMS
jgi:hypothetical protein